MLHHKHLLTYTQSHALVGLRGTRFPLSMLTVESRGAQFSASPSRPPRPSCVGARRASRTPLQSLPASAVASRRRRRPAGARLASRRVGSGHRRAPVYVHSCMSHLASQLQYLRSHRN